MAVTVISYPDNQINESFETAETMNSNEVIKLVWVAVSQATTDEYIEIVYNGVTTTLLIQDECRYTPVMIDFVNKFLKYFLFRLGLQTYPFVHIVIILGSQLHFLKQQCPS